MKSTFRAWVALLFLGAVGCGSGEFQGQQGKASSSSGGYLVVCIRGDPLTWNRMLATEAASHLITERMHASLLRINRLTQKVEPELAESWSFSEDGKILTFRLRPDVRFSDGIPFTAEDVAFTFRALHDPRVGSPLVETAKVEGEPLVAEVLDSYTVQFRLPRRTAVVERLFDSLYVLPRHRLEQSLEEGAFNSEYGIGADARSVVGLGPFCLERYLPGQRVVLRRNPYYWKRGSNGERLPHLAGIVFEILPDSNVRTLKLLAGEVDLQGELLPEDFIQLKNSEGAELRLLDLGPGMIPEQLWFNLNPKSPTVSKEQRAWFSDARFRKSISLAIDRESMVEAVYLRLASPAVGPVSPANRAWRNEAIEPYVMDREKARQLLREAGFQWNAKGDLEDSAGNAVRFTLVTNADNPHRTGMAVLIQEDLAKLGIKMSLVPLDRAALLGRITRTFDYDACLLGIAQTDPDPSAEMSLWLSRAPLHFWYPSQAHPATTWEARIDALMEQQMVALDMGERKALYDEVQAIVVEESPIIHLVVPHTLIGASRRVSNLKPTPFWHPTLWNSEELLLTAGNP